MTEPCSPRSWSAFLSSFLSTVAGSLIESVKWVIASLVPVRITGIEVSNFSMTGLISPGSVLISSIAASLPRICMEAYAAARIPRASMTSSDFGEFDFAMFVVAF